MKKIIVAGGAGFLGSNLCKKLLEEGSRVYAVDNLYTGRAENIAELKKLPGFKFYQTDISEAHELSEVLREIGSIDEIYNLACPASPPHYQKSPTTTIKTNVIGMMHLLDAATACGAKILQASTSEVYGDPTVHPQPEAYRGNVNPIGIRACYDEGKRCAETLCFDYNREFGTKIKVIRIFNTYGPNMDPKDGRVVSNFILQALFGKDITVYGDGRQTRSFCYVDDLIEGMVRMMNSEDDGFPGPVNLGNPTEFTMLKLAEKIIKMTDSSSKIVFCPLPQDDPLQRKPVIALAKEKLGWEPKVMLEDGLKKTIAYYASRIGEKKENQHE